MFKYLLFKLELKYLIGLLIRRTLESCLGEVMTLISSHLKVRAVPPYLTLFVLSDLKYIADSKYKLLPIYFQI